jgi:hypothetical protein
VRHNLAYEGVGSLPCIFVFAHSEHSRRHFQGWTLKKASSLLLRGQEGANLLFERFVASARLP